MKTELKKIAEVSEIEKVLRQFNSSFPIDLNEGTGEINQFAQKLSKHAEVILLLSEEKYIIGFEAFYANNSKTKEAFLSLIAVEEQYRGDDYAQKLLSKCFDICSQRGMVQLKLEVNKSNDRAIAFYKKNDFNFLLEDTDESYYMIKMIR